jgi:hypothetical protein
MHEQFLPIGHDMLYLSVPGPRMGDNGLTHMYAMYTYYAEAPFLGVTRSIYLRNSLP